MKPCSEPASPSETQQPQNSPSPPRGTSPLSLLNASRRSRPRRDSLSCRLRNSIHRTRNNIIDTCETRILAMAQRHGIVPREGNPGIVFHVADLPPGHSRESVAMMLTKTVESMNGQPPFLPSHAHDATPSPPDLLDSELGYPSSPSVQPSTPLLASRDADRVYELPALEEVDHVDKAQFQLLSPTIQHECVTDVKALQVSSNLYTAYSPCNDNLKLEPLKQRDVSYPYYPYRQTQPCFTSHLPYQPPENYPTTGPKLAPSIPPLQTRTLNVGANQSNYVQTPPRTTDTTTQHDHAELYVASYTMPKSKPLPRILTAGLRPLPTPSVPARSTSMALVPGSSQKVDLKTAASSLRKPDQRLPRSLARRHGVRDLRNVVKENTIQTNPSVIQTTGEVEKTPETGVANVRHRHERPLPLPLGEDSIPLEKAIEIPTRRPRPTGVYGASALLCKTSENALSSSDVHMDGFGESLRLLALPATPLPACTAHHALSIPELPPIPHVSTTSILREMKAENCAFMEDVSSSSSVSTGSLSLSSQQFDDKEQNLRQTNTKHTSTKEHYDLPYIPYSPSIVRRGTLKQLGGRVVQIRKRFEDTMTSSKRSQTFSALNAATQPRSSFVSTPMSDTPELPSKHRSATDRTDLIRASSTLLPDHVNSIRASSQLLPNPPVIRITSAPNSSESPVQRPSHHRSFSPTATLSRTRSSRPSTARSRPSNLTDTDTNRNPFPLYATLHPDQANHIRDNPSIFRETMSENISRRLQAASDEADASIVRHGEEAPNESLDEVKAADRTEYDWQWKRFADQEWNDRDRSKRAGRQYGCD